MTSVRNDIISGLYTPDSGSSRSGSTTPRGMETPVGKSRSRCLTPQSSVRDFDLNIENSFTPVWQSQSSVHCVTPVRQSQSPVHSDNDQLHMPNTDSETEEVKRESDEDCDAREDMYS